MKTKKIDNDDISSLEIITADRDRWKAVADLYISGRVSGSFPEPKRPLQKEKLDRSWMPVSFGRLWFVFTIGFIYGSIINGVLIYAIFGR
jgi:hypothetical protein